MNERVALDADPAGLDDIRYRLHDEATRRWTGVAREVKRAILQHDALSIGEKAPRLAMPTADKAHLFKRWLDEQLMTGVAGYDGSWVEPYVRTASARGAQGALADAAQAQLGFLLPGAAPSAKVCHAATVSSLAGICDDVSQRAHSVVAAGLLGKSRPMQIARLLDQAFGHGLKRTRMLAEHAVTQAFSQATLDALEASGVTHVGTISEHRRLHDAGPEDEPRDPQGRWTSGGHGYEFVSPNVGNIGFSEARGALTGRRESSLLEASGDVDRAVGISGVTTPVIGAWADGAEHSTMTVVDHADWDQLKLAAAMKGWLADQKQVLIFKEADEGETPSAALYSFDATGDLGQIHQRLLDDGVAFHTLQPMSDGAKVWIADPEQSIGMAGVVSKAAHGAEVHVREGKAEFLGTSQDTGSDREQRDAARRAYEGLIAESPVQGAQALWQGLHHRWAKTLAQISDALALWFEDAARKTPQPQHPRTGQFAKAHVVAREKRRSKRTGRFRKQGLSPEEQRKEELTEARFGCVVGRLDVMTQGDDRVCDVCDEISASGPYGINEARSLIPAHPNCRCLFVAAGTMRDAWALDFDPNEPRDPAGKWTTVFVHGGRDFGAIDPAKYGSGERGGIRPLGEGLYGGMALSPDDLETAVELAKVYGAKYGGFVHAFGLHVDDPNVAKIGYGGDKWSRGGLGAETAHRRIGGGFAKQVEYEVLPWKSGGRHGVEAAVHDPAILSRLGKWPASTPTAEIVRSLRGGGLKDFDPDEPRDPHGRWTALQGSQGHQALISTRPVTATGVGAEAKAAATAAKDVYKTIDMAAMKAAPEQFKANTALFKDAKFYPGMRTDEVRGSADDVAKAVKDRMVDNLVFLANKVKNGDFGSKDDFKRWAGWYEGAHKIAQGNADKYKTDIATASGVIAALSPQNDWNGNVYQADVVMKAMSNKQGMKWDEAMSAKSKAIWKGQRLAMAQEIEGKTLGDLDKPMEGDPEGEEGRSLRLARKGMWIRTENEAHETREHRQVNPEGTFGEVMKTKAGLPTPAKWKSVSAIANAVQAYESRGDANQLSEAMGDRHKVRSFYNNILDPDSLNGDVTIDTHAVGAAWLTPTTSEDVSVYHALNTTPLKADQPEGWVASKGSAVTGVKGTYGFYAQAYRDAAEKLHIQPRQLQSVVWEAKQRLFSKTVTGTKVKGAVDAVWRRFHSGELDLQAAQHEVVKAAQGSVG